MLKIIEDYFERLEELRADIHAVVDGLPPEAIDWSPGPPVNALAVLLAHVAGSLRYWVGDVAGREPSGRDREAEFRTQGVDAAQLTARLDQAFGAARQVLERLDAADLGATRVPPRGGNEVSVMWALLHALEHTATHLGHMQALRDAWNQKPGSG